MPKLELSYYQKLFCLGWLAGVISRMGEEEQDPIPLELIFLYHLAEFHAKSFLDFGGSMSRRFPELYKFTKDAGEGIISLKGKTFYEKGQDLINKVRTELESNPE